MGTDKVLKVRERNLERYKVCVGVCERGQVGKKKMEEGGRQENCRVSNLLRAREP